ncbi:MAG: DUF1343 domain-containing protein, partial [Chlamydiae bacterium]|nr:DUF1343 domain-containing protein [Chlamydiota bacterium]
MVIFLWGLFLPCLLFGKVSLGVDVFWEEGYEALLKDKKVALVTNHTGVNKELVLTSDLFKKRSFQLIALF